MMEMAGVDMANAAFQLAPHLVPLREKALHIHRENLPLQVPEIVRIKAAAWALRTPEEDWLMWRARESCAVLEQMPLEIEPGEQIVGRPRMRVLTDDELPRHREAAATLPPFPGGDPAHFHPDHTLLLSLGIDGMLARIDAHAAAAGDDEARLFYQACRLAMLGMQRYAERLADECGARGNAEMAAICRRLSHAAPASFHEAIQLMWIATIALWFGGGHSLTNPGRMDQILRPFHDADVAAGRLTPQQALDLICGLFIQCNRILQPGSAIAVMVGGRNAKGEDVTNDLSYLCLIARQLTRLVYPTVGVAWHSGTPREFTDFACRMLATGIGCPAFFNDEVIVEGLREQGVSAEDSYHYMNSTCVEIKVCGASNMWVTAPYFNLCQLLLDAMAEAAASPPPDFSAFEALVERHIAAKVATAAQHLDQIWQRRRREGGFPLASCFISDCLARGRDFDRGGARYNWVENSFVGLANLADGMLAIQHLVYEAKALSVSDFHAALVNDFADHEALRQRICRTLPRYGNDDPAADATAARWADFLVATTEANRVGPHHYVPGFFCWIQHGVLGAQTGATPDGRRAGMPLADGAGAAQGRERRGPTAAVLSTTSWSHRRALGGLVHNIKFSASQLQNERGRQAMWAVIETYLRRGGLEIQINVAGADQLRAAQECPEGYADLIVRVAGYSDYFTHLSRTMQDEVISRSEFQLA